MKSELANRLKLRYSPVALVYTNEKPAGALEFDPCQWACVTALLSAAAKGRTAVFSLDSCPCDGGRVGLGLSDQFAAGIEYFLSTGNDAMPLIAGMPEPEAFKKTPSLAKEWADSLQKRAISEKYVVFTPIENLKDTDTPQIIICYANPDQLTALIVLANYDRTGVNAVMAPFSSGCMTACLFALNECGREHPKAVIGMTDVSARPHIDADLLSFSMPYSMYQEMEANIPGSFLDKSEWKKVAKRIK